MATKAVNLKMEESRIADLKQVAAVFHMSMTDIINEALDVYTRETPEVVYSFLLRSGQMK